MKSICICTLVVCFLSLVITQHLSREHLLSLLQVDIWAILPRGSSCLIVFFFSCDNWCISGGTLNFTQRLSQQLCEKHFTNYVSHSAHWQATRSNWFVRHCWGLGNVPVELWSCHCKDVRNEHLFQPRLLKAGDKISNVLYLGATNTWSEKLLGCSTVGISRPLSEIDYWNTVPW